MSAAAPFEGRVLLADTSAWVRARSPAVNEVWFSAIEADQIVTFPLVELELLYAARDHDELADRQTSLAALRRLPLTDSIARAATVALVELSALQPGYHRVSVPDLLIAAAAQDAGIDVLHYDHDYDRLAEVLDFESRWIAPPGSL